MIRLARNALLFAALMGLLLPVGCTTTTVDIDLTDVGILNLLISRSAQSAVATATATVQARGALGLAQDAVLADDQIIKVKNVPLDPTALTDLGLESVYSATVESVDGPSTYKIEFDNQGATSSFNAVAPEDLDDVMPGNGEQVTYAGFDVEWDASGDTENIVISIEINGLAQTIDDNGQLGTTDHTVTFNNLADDGEFSIGESDLEFFVPGSIELTVRRTKTISQKIGFSEGTITLVVEEGNTLTLVDP